MVKLSYWSPALLILSSCLVFAQENPGGYETFHPNVEVLVDGLSPLMARTPDLPDVLLTSLDIVFHDPAICCGRDSVLEDRATAADPLSLKEVASKVEGTWALSDGRRIRITAEMLGPTPSLDISYRIVNTLKSKHSLLLEWNSHLYVLYGAIFDEVSTPDVGSQYMIHKLLLLDTRYSDARRKVTFNRDTDDWTKVHGLLLFTVGAQ